MPQKHDKGYQKRVKAQQKTDDQAQAVSTETMARNLVKRGLAEPIILGPRKA